MLVVAFLVKDRIDEWWAIKFHDTATLGTIVRLGIPEAVPLDGSISFGELARKVGVLESKLGASVYPPITLPS